MAQVAVLHNTLDLRGGADAVCLHVCEALSAAHDVTLFTLSRSSPADLDPLFGTDVSVPLHRPPGTDLLAGLFARGARWLGPQLPARSVLLDRIFRRHADDFDLAVSTANEFVPPIPSVQYVHFPQFNRATAPTVEAGRLDGLWTRLANLADRTLPGDATLLANSGWTAGVVDRIYDRRPEVLFPPVDPIPDPLPWADREAGAVVLGRLAPDKRIRRAVRIVDGVRERGHDLHLHVVGSAPPAYRGYLARVRGDADAREYVSVETDAPRSRVEELLTTHRYGLNAKPREHFGMAAAEYVAGGMVPLVPDSGGQREVVGGDERYLYSATADAVDTLAARIRDGAGPSLRRDRFASGRFHDAIRRHVAARL